MVQSGGWLSRVARRFGELMSGTTADAVADFGPEPSVAETVAFPQRDAPSTHGASTQLPDGVRVGDNGRFVAGGYSFSTLEQATHHLASLSRPRSALPGLSLAGSAALAPATRDSNANLGPSASHAEVDRNATSPSGTPEDIPEGVRMGGDGRFVAGQYSFSTLEQAKKHLAALIQPRPDPPTFSPAPAPASKASTGRRASSRWVGQKEALDVGGRSVVLEFAYYGTPISYEPRHDKSRIDPSLPIDPRGDRSGATLSYWQTYAGLDPKARWTYLDWLESGRSDPTTPIGYVFLFFYGLEQRLLVDDAREDVPALFAEVRRLVQIYGENYSFQSYASKFLALAAVYEPTEGGPPTQASTHNYELELPLDLRVRLGRRLRDDQPFDADDALSWVLGLPDVYLRTPGQRCFDELRELWTARFALRHPEGLRVRKPKAQVRYEYRAASGAFVTNLTLEIPDVSKVSAPLGPLRTLLDDCMEDLSAYSRLLGRDPEARGRLRGDLLLPQELRPSRPSLARCRDALRASGGVGAPSAISAVDLARVLDLEVGEDSDRLSTGLVRQMGVALDALDLGCEPDRRYGPATALRRDASLSLFEAPGGGAVDPDRPAYLAARGMVEVAMLAAASDGEVADSEIDAIERRLRSMPDLQPHEVTRLLACGRALAADPPKVRAALKKLADVPPASKAAFVASAIEAVLADGRVLPDEVRFLEALHAALGLPLNALYSALHRAGEDHGPVEVLRSAPEQLVPLPADEEPEGVLIDARRLERIRGETTQVSAMLAAIFMEDEPDPQPAAAPPSRPEAARSAFEGLDAAHSDLLVRLMLAPLSRSEFDAAAASLRLMPEGAIETLNEWGFDRFGEPVVEDDESVSVVPEILDQLQRIGVHA